MEFFVLYIQTSNEMYFFHINLDLKCFILGLTALQIYTDICKDTVSIEAFLDGSSPVQDILDMMHCHQDDI